MKSIFTAGRMVGIALVLAMAVGCSRTMPFEEDFREMESVIAMGRSCGQSVHVLGERIAALPDIDERRRCIERFKEVFLAPETERADYNLIRNRSGGRNNLVDPCMEIARRCGLSFSEVLEIRIAFIKWLRAERKRIVDSGVSPNDGRKLGLHITAGFYLDGLGGKYFRNLWRLELQFDEDAERECRPDELERLRARLETFLGRPIRTKEKIMHDRQEFSRRIMERVKCPRTSDLFPVQVEWD